MIQKPTMLIVDDTETNRAILREAFQDEYMILEAADGCEALDILDREPVTVVLLDLYMPKKDGYEVLRAAHSDPKLEKIPFIVNTQYGEEENELRALRLGAEDFISKPYHIEVVRCRVNHIVKRHRLENRQNTLGHDPLTKIYNRELFCFKTAEMLQNNPEEKYVLICWDIEHFKIINDLFGTAVGDGILKEIGERLRELKGIGTYGRMTDDHFAACFPKNLFDEENLKEQLLRRFQSLHFDYDVVLYVGVYEIDDPSLPIEKMYDRANLALGTIKGSYLNRIAFYDDSMRSNMMMEQQIIGEMNEALKKDQFEIYLQPIYSISTGKPNGAEALVRWIHPQRGIISPAVFIPLFERNGFITKLDSYVWEQTCRYQSERLREGKAVVPISVNVSRMDFYNPKLCDILIGLVEKYQLSPAMVKLEITESAYTDNPHQLLKAMETLQRYGFQIMMDDFGSGYSSLNMLKDVPVDILKIDMKFVSDLGESERAGSVLNSVIRMAKWLEMRVVAEGVETETQLAYLRSMGCDSIQGYYYSPPLPCDGFSALLDTQPQKKDEEEIYSPAAVMKEIKNLWETDKNGWFIGAMVGGMGIYELYDGMLEIIRVNEGYYEITGSTPRTLLHDTKDALSWIYEEDRPRLLNKCAQAQKNGKIVRWIVRRYHQKGHLMWLTVSIRFLGSRAGRWRFCFVFQNITDHKAEEQLQYLAQYATALRGQYNVVCELDYTDRTAKTLYSDDHAMAQKGNQYQLDDMLGDYAKNLVHPMDRKRFLEICGESYIAQQFVDAGKDSIREEFGILKPDGSYHRTQLLLMRMKDVLGHKTVLSCSIDLEADSPQNMAATAYNLKEPPFERPDHMAFLRENAPVSSCPAEEAGDQGANRVLVVDDNQINRIMLKKILSPKYTVEEAENGRQALEIYQENPDRIDAILLDIVMPVMDGYEFLERRRQNARLAAVPVIVMSQTENRESELQALDLGASDFLKKPYEPEIILRRLENLIRLKEAVRGRNSAQNIINHLPGGVMICEFAKGGVEIKYLNNNVAEMAGGMTEKSLDKMDLFELVYPEDRERIKKKMQKSVEILGPFVCNFRCRRGNGMIGWVRCEGNFAYANHQKIGYYLLFADITHEKETELQLMKQTELLQKQRAALEEMTARQQVAFEETNIEIWEYDVVQSMLKISQSVADTLGSGTKIKDIRANMLKSGSMTDKEVDRALQVFLRIEQGETPVEHIYCLNEGSKNEQWRNVHYTTLFNSDHQPIYAIGVSWDITAEMKVKHRYEQETAYRSILLQDALAYMDLDVDEQRCISFGPQELQNEPILCEKGLEKICKGMVDRYVHPEDQKPFQSLCKNYLETERMPGGTDSVECRVLLRNEYHWVSVSFHRSNGPKRLCMLVCVNDIHERKMAELAMRDKAQRDSLTGLLNRKTFEDLVRADLKKRRSKREKSAFLILDLDDFKLVNDTYGHRYGDEVLCKVAATLKSIFRAEDYVARLGGDEMVVYLPNLPDHEAALRKGDQICRTMLENVEKNEKIPITCSVGVALCPENGDTFETLYANADIALYHAKDRGKNQCCFYNPAEEKPKDSVLKSKQE